MPGRLFVSEQEAEMIPVIDLFAGAGGLGEGFSAYRYGEAEPFRVRLSIEQDAAAHATLLLRAFFRRFPVNEVPEDYYRFLRREISLAALFKGHPSEAVAAGREARRARLGDRDPGPEIIDDWIVDGLDGRRAWVLVGGPPCQAYSIAGRGRNRSQAGYVPENDGRHFLYQEYLRVIARHWPPVFVMENVPGILSARVGGVKIFERILEDLSDPAGLSQGETTQTERAFRYRLYSLTVKTEHDMFGVPVNPTNDFVIESQRFGIPQSRRRVIILGVRDDIGTVPGVLSEREDRLTVSDVLKGLPRLRSGLSREEDSDAAWMQVLSSVTDMPWFRSPETAGIKRVVAELRQTVERLRPPREGRGATFVRCRAPMSKHTYSKFPGTWYLDDRLDGVCNSETRSHFPPDLHRYLFAAAFAVVFGRSPALAEFPEALLPAHRNVGKALTEGDFGDRFRVQIAREPATTITSHIARDGHYYIHYDATQCRSLTVREAARLQTFPDNYFFSGNLGEQYTQIGNAVPPLLAVQIAGIVRGLLSDALSEYYGRFAVA